MGLEIENNLVAGVRYDGNVGIETILSQYGIRSVTRTGVGIYRVVTVDNLGDAEALETSSVEPGAAPPTDRVATHQKVPLTINSWDVFTFGPLVLGTRSSFDAVWSLKIFRIATGR